MTPSRETTGAVTLAQAQKEMRFGMMGGFVGQAVSGLIWLGSAALATWGTPFGAITLLVVAGLFIFPLTKLGLLAMRHRYKVSRGNPLNGLGMQAAFVLPLCLPVVGAAALYRLDWFYPAFMIVLGAHYLPFVTLYGMRSFYVPAAVLCTAGFLLATYVRAPFPTGAWITAVVLLAFAVWGGWLVHKEAGAAEAARTGEDATSERR